MDKERAAPALAERLIDIGEVESMVGLKRGAIYNRVRAGVMPKPVRLSYRCTRWRLSQVQAFIADQTETAPA